jgi:hypothetical protein
VEAGQARRPARAFLGTDFQVEEEMPLKQESITDCGVVRRERAIFFWKGRFGGRFIRSRLPHSPGTPQIVMLST